MESTENSEGPVLGFCGNSGGPRKNSEEEVPRLPVATFREAWKANLDENGLRAKPRKKTK